MSKPINPLHDFLLADFEDKILDVVDNREKFTRSDLQGVVMALVLKIYRAGMNSQEGSKYEIHNKLA